jgi:hypothetical protein
MKPAHHQNQDTNDRFLANMQRNGTFSVVPRIAAGEITPDGLVAIGNIAKKYNLYTKVSIRVNIIQQSIYLPHSRSPVANESTCLVQGKKISPISGKS